MTKKVIMKNFGKFLSDWRFEHGKTMQELATLAGINQGLISKYEACKRLPSENHLLKLSKAMQIPFGTIKKEFLADKISNLLKYETNPIEVLQAAEERVDYFLSNEVFNLTNVSESVNHKLKKIDKLKKLWQASKPLNNFQLQKMQEYFSIRYTFDSNRIEGNTLTFKETHLIVNEGLTIGGKSLNEHLEAVGHSDAIDWMRELVIGNEDVTRRNLLDLHRIIFKKMDSSIAGRYRNVPVMISGSEHKPPQPFLLDKLMEDYFIYYERKKRTLHPVILAAEMHERLVSIHPFIDGNGRSSRLIMNLILLKAGYTIAILKGDYDSRMSYYSALEQVQMENNTEPFYHLILDKVEASLIEHLAMV